uniref:Uncharacterized protein n=1 Tax=viral metagenome TaxID=1070528 RepID=A0A6C0HSL0_9ZZZZ
MDCDISIQIPPTTNISYKSKGVYGTALSNKENNATSQMKKIYEINIKPSKSDFLGKRM